MQDRFTTNATDDSFHELMGEIDVLHRAQEDVLFKVSAPLPEIQPRVTDDRFERLMTDLDELEDESESLFRRVGKKSA